MTWLSVVLIALGLADLVRARGAGTVVGPAPRVRLAQVVGIASLAVLAPLVGLTTAPDLIAFAVAALALVGWITTSTRTQTTGRQAAVPLALFGALLVGLVAFSGFAGSAAGPFASWVEWADLPGPVSPSPERVLLLSGLALVNLATANVIVRLVLLAIGALRPDQVTAAQAAQSAASDPQPADRLKGGRLLGPMERLVILGLGLAGEFGATGIVIAAKGLLRFPEIQAAGRQLPQPTTTGPVGIDDVTEYFLVGSFVSWLIAFVCLGLTRL